MPLIDCIKASNLATEPEIEALASKVSAMVQKGVPEIEAEYTVKNEFVNEVYEKLNKDLNAVKKSAGVKTSRIDKVEPPNFKEELPQETGKRQTVQKIQASEEIPDKVKEGTKEFEDYVKRHNEETRQRASNWIDEQGEEEALASVNNKLKNLFMPHLDKQAVRMELFNRNLNRFKEASAKGHTKKAEQYFDKMMEASKSLAENATEAAQSLQFLSTLGGILGNTEMAVRFATQQIEESREGVLRNYKPLVNTAQNIIEEIEKLTKDELLKSQRIRDLINEFSKKSGQQKRVSSEKAVKVFGKTKEQAKKDADEAIKGLYNMVKSGKAFATIVPDPRAIKLLSQWAYNRVIESGISLIEFIQEVNSKFPDSFNVDQIEEAWNESAKEADKKIQEDADREAKEKVVKSIIDPKEKKEKSYEQKQREEKKRELKSSIDSQVIKAIASYAKGNQNAFIELTDALVSQLEVAPENVSRFTEAIQKIVDQKRTEIKEKTVKKYLPKKSNKDTAKKKHFYDKVVELSETQALKDKDYADQVAAVMNIPSMTPEIVKEIDAYVQAINKAPEGKFKNTEVIKMLDYIAQQQRFNLTDYMVASYKAGLFSGLDTQALNNISNAFGGLAFMFESFVSNPKDAIAMIRSFADKTSVTQAFNEAALLMQTGIDPRFVDTNNRRQLEQQKRSFWGFAKGLTGKKQILDPSLEQQKKYVFRALAAGDVIATTPLSNAAQTAMFRRVGVKIKKSLSGDERKNFRIDTYIHEQMGLTEENINLAQKQAEKEYDQGLLGEKNDKTKKSIIKVRRDEIIQQSRNPEIVQRANEFAQSQVFVNPPVGFTGILASQINQLIQKIPLLNALVPVVNIGANITQRGMQYTPPFVAIRGIVYYLKDLPNGVSLATKFREDVDAWKSGDPFMEQRVKRATAGFIATALILALFHEGDDDEENLISKLTGQKIRIHGGGPGRIGNMKPTYQKQETGWKPYTIQYNDQYLRYDLIPGYNVLFATMGEYYDAVRYGRMEKKDGLNRFAWAMSNSYQVILKNSFLQSIYGTLEGVFDGDAKKFFRTFVTAPISGYAFPKFQRNLINFFDNNIYSANDFQEIATRSIPVLNGYTNEVMLNALGEPIEKNWWDRIDLFSENKKEKVIWNQMDSQKYSLPMPSMSQLSESLNADVDTKTFNDFYTYRGESIKKYFEKYQDRLSKIEDKKIYEKTFDAIVTQAADEAKYRITKKKKLPFYEEPISFYFPEYEKSSDGKITKKVNKYEEGMKEMEREMRRLKF